VAVSITADNLVRIGVSDVKRQYDLRATRPEPDATGGRGLLFVDELSRDWGVIATPEGGSVGQAQPTVVLCLTVGGYDTLAARTHGPPEGMVAPNP
jgi:hypothetical protein